MYALGVLITGFLLRNLGFVDSVLTETTNL